MAINLDEIIGNATGVEDLLAALNLESGSNQKASAQLAQLASAAEGVSNSGSWLEKLKGAVDPKSTAGTLKYDQLYKKYYIDMTSQGETPVDKEEFIKALESKKPQQS